MLESATNNITDCNNGHHAVVYGSLIYVALIESPLKTLIWSGCFGAIRKYRCVVSMIYLWY